MRVLKCTLSNIYKDEFFRLPNSFTLNKSLELNFETYKNVKEDIFRNITRADKNRK
jgi:hypothetical protein